jgi:hypothetical protein
MFKTYFEKIRQCIIRAWRFIKKESPVVMILNGKRIYESDPLGQRILRRLQKSKKRAGGKNIKVS